MKIFIIGISGFLGSNLAIALRDEHTVYGSYFSNKININDFRNDVKYTFKLLGIKSKWTE